MTETNYKVLLLPGDGIGPEVVKQVELIIEYLNENTDLSIETEHGLIGGIAYDETGNPLPAKTIESAKESDAILLGAVGGYKWESLDISVRPEKGLLGIRKELGLFANLRPAVCFKELVDASSLKPELVADLDILIVRELTGGIYFGHPRGIREEGGKRIGINTLYYEDYEVKRIAKVAFELAAKRGSKVTSIDKANVLEATEMWRQEVQKLRDAEYTNITLDHMYVDNASMQLVRMPKQFDVIVTTNMFGDIISDTAAMLTGSLGMLPSASLGEVNENGKRYALYEPVHGSAPDIAGKGIANPIATILSFSMMLRYSFSQDRIADSIENAVKEVLSKGVRTKDIAASDTKNIASTSEMGAEIIKAIKL